MRGTFSKAGKYTITFKLIDRDDSDNVITSKTFSLNVQEQTTTTPPVTDGTEEIPENPSQEQKPEENNKPENSTEQNKEEEPTTLPKTGHTAYITIIPIMIALVIMFIALKKKN